MHAGANHEVRPGSLRGAARTRFFWYNWEKREVVIMSIILNLPPELECELTAEAARLGLPLQDYLLRILEAGRGASIPLHSGADLVAYWKTEGLVGTRSDIENSQDYARKLRKMAEARSPS
jgi:hypothetical protein